MNSLSNLNNKNQAPPKKKHCVTDNEIFEFTQKYKNLKCWFKISSLEINDVQAIIDQILFYSITFTKKS